MTWTRIHCNPDKHATLPACTTAEELAQQILWIIGIAESHCANAADKTNLSSVLEYYTDWIKRRCQNVGKEQAKDENFLDFAEHLPPVDWKRAKEQPE